MLGIVKILRQEVGKTKKCFIVVDIFSMVQKFCTEELKHRGLRWSLGQRTKNKSGRFYLIS